MEGNRTLHSTMAQNFLFGGIKAVVKEVSKHLEDIQGPRMSLCEVKGEYSRYVSTHGKGPHATRTNGPARHTHYSLRSQR